VPVRITVEPRANAKFPGNQTLLEKFKAAGIPMLQDAALAGLLITAVVATSMLRSTSLVLMISRRYQSRMAT
jgi:hypothetical protein